MIPERTDNELQERQDSKKQRRTEKIKKEQRETIKTGIYSTENAFTVLEIGKLLNTISSQSLELKVLSIFERETNSRNYFTQHFPLCLYCYPFFKNAQID